VQKVKETNYANMIYFNLKIISKSFKPKQILLVLTIAKSAARFIKEVN